MKGLRIMAFYDGGYFKAGQIYFRYQENRGWFSIPALHGLFEKYVAQKAKEPQEPTKVVGAHYYDGRTSVQAADADQLQSERRFELALIQGGVVPHYLPMRETPKTGVGSEDRQFTLAQKGIDVQYALDVLDYAHTDRFDVAVLVTGDADFVPLVRKITSIGRAFRNRSVEGQEGLVAPRHVLRPRSVRRRLVVAQLQSLGERPRLEGRYQDAVLPAKGERRRRNVKGGFA